MKLYQATAIVRLPEGVTVGLTRQALKRRKTLVTPLEKNKTFTRVVLNYTLDFKQGELLLLEPENAKGLPLFSLEPADLIASQQPHGSNPTEDAETTQTGQPPADLPPAETLIAQGKAIGEAHPLVDPLAAPPQLPPGLDAIDPVSPAATPEPSDAVPGKTLAHPDESENGDGHEN